MPRRTYAPRAGRYRVRDIKTDWRDVLAEIRRIRRDQERRDDQ